MDENPKYFVQVFCTLSIQSVRKNCRHHPDQGHKINIYFLGETIFQERSIMDDNFLPNCDKMLMHSRRFIHNFVNIDPFLMNFAPFESWDWELSNGINFIKNGSISKRSRTNRNPLISRRNYASKYTLFCCPPRLRTNK